MHTTLSTTQYEALAETLWRERHVTEVLLYRLRTARLVFAADERRYVGMAVSEVEEAIEALRRSEERRTEVVDDIAGALGVRASELSLRQLAELAPEPWRVVFADHREHFLRVAGEIEETVAENRRLVSASLADVSRALGALTGTSSFTTYTADGRGAATPAGPATLDRTL